MKRSFDIVFSFFGLLLLVPFLIIIGVLVKIDSEGPVFYKQRRIGLHFTPFNIYKFRTMVQNADENGLQITAGGDNRITRVGKVLRKTKIDEIPQLFNVLKGEMSFVGPRPEVDKYVQHYRKEYEEILSMRPGITDMASIIYRNEESVLAKADDPDAYYKQILLPKKIKLAKDYIRKSSLSFDMRIIVMTILKIISPAYKINNQN